MTLMRWTCASLLWKGPEAGGWSEEVSSLLCSTPSPRDSGSSSLDALSSPKMWSLTVVQTHLYHICEKGGKEREGQAVVLLKF